MVNLLLIILVKKGIMEDKAARKLAEDLRTRAIPDNYEMALTMLENLISRSEKSLDRRVYVPTPKKNAKSSVESKK